MNEQMTTAQRYDMASTKLRSQPNRGYALSEKFDIQSEIRFHGLRNDKKMQSKKKYSSKAVN
jgi:hypothetical protein